MTQERPPVIVGVFSEQRSGTHLLKSYLNDHPDVVFVREMARRARNFDAILHGDATELIAERDTRHPHESQAQMLVFVLHGTDLRPRFQRPCRSRAIRWICLHRGDLVARYVSLMTAEATKLESRPMHEAILNFDEVAPALHDAAHGAEPAHTEP